MSQSNVKVARIKAAVHFSALTSSRAAALCRLRLTNISYENGKENVNATRSRHS